MRFRHLKSRLPQDFLAFDNLLEYALTLSQNRARRRCCASCCIQNQSCQTIYRL